MRTTLHLDDEAYRIAVRHAAMQKIGLGAPKQLPKITAEQVKRLAEEW